MELALTARTFNAAEARALGLVSEVLPDAAALHEKALQVAAAIAAKSPVAVTGTKRVLLNARSEPCQILVQPIYLRSSPCLLAGL